MIGEMIQRRCKRCDKLRKFLVGSLPDKFGICGDCYYSDNRPVVETK